jgi:putative FmdB family regulatory protein
MPTYLYKCKTCGKEFEYNQRITEDALTNCPKEICEQTEKGIGLVDRRISKNIGLVFNGSGFYLTDYGKKHSSVAPVAEKHSETSSCGNCEHSKSCETSS